MHLGGEAVADCLLLASGNFDSITSSSQVADNLGLIIGVPKATADKVHRDRVRLIIGDGDQRLGRVTVDKLDTEDLGSRERGLGRDSQSNLCFIILSILQVQNQTISQLSHATWSLRQIKDETLTAAKPVPTKAWRESRARERKPKRVILKPEESKEIEEKQKEGKVKGQDEVKGNIWLHVCKTGELTQPDSTRGLRLIFFLFQAKSTITSLPISINLIKVIADHW